MVFNVFSNTQPSNENLGLEIASSLVALDDARRRHCDNR